MTRPRPVGPAHGRLAVAAVAAGALATAGHGVATAGLVGPAPESTTETLALRAATTSTDDGATTTRIPGTTAASPTTAARGSGPTDAATTGVLTTPSLTTPARTTTAAAPPVRTEGQAGSLAKSRKLADAAVAKANASRFVKPAQGQFTSGFGARWGAEHKGVDIANSIGTPIVAVASGRVLEAGPASGFGQWVRIQHDDGTISVYGHVNQYFVQAGQRVSAGDRIAEIGNKGQSTGPHLHFEIWLDGSKKVNPLPWLAERGIDLGSGGGDSGD